jgi:cytochrome c oxidase subunit II
MKRYLAQLLLFLPFAAMAPAMADSPRTIEVTVARYEFSPRVIEVGVGERVRLNITSTDGDHGFRVQPFGVDAQIPADGRAVSVDLTPTQAGVFDIQCSNYCGRGHKIMRAKLVVTAAR